MPLLWIPLLIGVFGICGTMISFVLIVREALRGYSQSRHIWPHAKHIWIACFLVHETLILGGGACFVGILLLSYGSPILATSHPQAFLITMLVGAVLLFPGVLGSMIWTFRVYRVARHRYGSERRNGEAT